jgi:hypothetical protein
MIGATVMRFGFFNWAIGTAFTRGRYRSTRNLPQQHSTEANCGFARQPYSG